MAEVITIDKDGQASDAVAAVAAALRAGRVVVVPTDTVYGLSAPVYRAADIGVLAAGGAASLWLEPVEELYRIKGRAGEQPSIILARDWEYAALLAVQSLHAIARFCEAFPRPVTAVVAARDGLGSPAVNSRGAVALRVPGAGFVKALLTEYTFLYSVSANEAGGGDARTLEEVPAAMLSRVALAVDSGPTLARTPSAVVDFTVAPPAVIRGDGALREALGQFRL